MGSRIYLLYELRIYIFYGVENIYTLWGRIIYFMGSEMFPSACSTLSDESSYPFTLQVTNPLTLGVTGITTLRVTGIITLRVTGISMHRSAI